MLNKEQKMNDCYILENGSQILLRNNRITQDAQRTNKLLYNVRGLAIGVVNCVSSRWNGR